jgi:hypothetical protein
MDELERAALLLRDFDHQLELTMDELSQLIAHYSLKLAGEGAPLEKTLSVMFELYLRINLALIKALKNLQKQLLSSH